MKTHSDNPQIGKPIVVPGTGSIVLNVSSETDTEYLVQTYGGMARIKKEYVVDISDTERAEMLEMPWILYPAYSDIRRAYETEGCMRVPPDKVREAIVWPIRLEY